MSTAAPSPQLQQPAAPPQPQPQPLTTSAFVIQAPGDIADWEQLPAPAAIKIRQLRSELADARSAWRNVSDKEKQARENKKIAVARLKQIQQSGEWFEVSYAQIGPVADDHPELLGVRKRLELADAELARLAPIAAARENAIQQIARLVETIENYFDERLRAVRTIELHNGRPKPALKKGEAPLEAVERCRRRVRELDADHRRVASAPWHSDYAKAKARAEIEKLAARGTPDVSPLLQTRDGTIGWRERPLTERMLGGRAVAVELDPAPVPLVAWLHKNLLIERIEKEIDAASDDKHALTAEQRTTRLAEIERERLTVERDEEAWLTAAVAGGATILRRVDCDARAVLSLSDSMPSPR